MIAEAGSPIQLYTNYFKINGHDAEVAKRRLLSVEVEKTDGTKVQLGEVVRMEDIVHTDSTHLELNEYIGYYEVILPFDIIINEGDEVHGGTSENSN